MGLGTWTRAVSMEMLDMDPGIPVPPRASRDPPGGMKLLRAQYPLSVLSAIHSRCHLTLEVAPLGTYGTRVALRWISSSDSILVLAGSSCIVYTTYHVSTIRRPPLLGLPLGQYIVQKSGPGTVHFWEGASRMCYSSEIRTRQQEES